jgi:hypothetical protein
MATSWSGSLGVAIVLSPAIGLNNAKKLRVMPRNAEPVGSVPAPDRR